MHLHMQVCKCTEDPETEMPNNTVYQCEISFFSCPTATSMGTVMEVLLVF